MIMEFVTLANGTDVGKRIGNPVPWTKEASRSISECVRLGHAPSVPSYPNRDSSATGMNVYCFKMELSLNLSSVLLWIDDQGNASIDLSDRETNASSSTLEANATRLPGALGHTGSIVPIMDLHPIPSKFFFCFSLTGIND